MRTPSVWTREQWGAVGPDHGKLHVRNLDSIDTLYVHYTDVAMPAPFDPAYGGQVAASAAQLRTIQDDHMRKRGWADIAYHWAVDPAGDVFELRDKTWVGAGVENHNRNSYHVVVLTDGDVTADAFDGLRWVIAGVRFAMGRDLNLRWHGEDSATACPEVVLEHFVASGRTAVGSIGDASAWFVADEMPAGQDGAGIDPVSPPAPADPSPADVYLPQTIQFGAAGALVAELQRELSQAGYPPAHSTSADGSWDGQFGNWTRDAVSAFQGSHGLTVDGIVGPITWAALLAG